MNEETEREKKTKKPLGKVSFILGINFVALLAILLFYIQFNEKTAITHHVETIGDFQIYISSSKSVYLTSEPFDLKVYLTNLSSNYKDFEIYTFNLKITDNSTSVYFFNASKVIRSQISPKSTVLIYEANGGNDFSAGNYVAKALINLGGRIVSLEKSFKYISDVSPILVCSNDFVVDGQRANASLYIRNNTSDTPTLNVQKMIFSLLNEKNQVLSTNTVTLNSTLTIPPYQQFLTYDYQTNPIQNPGDYKLVAKIMGTQDMAATTVISVINKDGISDTSGIKIASNMPSHVKSKMPVSFSVFLINDTLQKKYVVLSALTVIIKKGDVELYRFSDSAHRNIKISDESTSVIFDSRRKTLTFPEKGTYDFEVTAKIGNNSISYNKKIQSS